MPESLSPLQYCFTKLSTISGSSLKDLSPITLWALGNNRSHTGEKLTSIPALFSSHPIRYDVR